LIAKGYCKVGLDVQGTDRKLRSLDQWNKDVPVPFKHGKTIRDPPRYPDATDYGENKNIEYDSDGEPIPFMDGKELEEMQKENAKLEAAEGEEN
jgi:hypothetical protein